MKIKVIEHVSRNENGEKVSYYEFVDEKGKPARGAFTIKDGRPFDLIMNEYVD